MSRFDLIVVGHITLDLISRAGEKTREAMGGVSTYTSIAAARLGAKVGVVSKVGDDFQRGYLDSFRKAGVDLSGLSITGGGTTIFENIYDENGRRTQRLLNCAESIECRDIPEKYFSSRCFHFGPVYHEVSYEIIRSIHEKGILTVLDAQGYCRKREKDLSIKLCAWKEMENILPHVNILKCDEEEAKIMTGKSNVEAAAQILNDLGSEIILVTQGGKGSTLCYNGKVKRIPAIPPDKIVDLTGAGDTYVAGFIVEYLRTGDPEWSALFASGAASFVIEGLGTSTMPTREEVLKRLRRKPPRNIK